MELIEEKKQISHTVFNKKLTEFQKGGYNSDDAISSSMMEIIDFAFGRKSAFAVQLMFHVMISWGVKPR